MKNKSIHQMLHIFFMSESRHPSDHRPTLSFYFSPIHLWFSCKILLFKHSVLLYSKHLTPFIQIYVSLQWYTGHKKMHYSLRKIIRFYSFHMTKPLQHAPIICIWNLYLQVCFTTYNFILNHISSIQIHHTPQSLHSKYIHFLFLSTQHTI